MRKKHPAFAENWLTGLLPLHMQDGLVDAIAAARNTLLKCSPSKCPEAHFKNTERWARKLWHHIDSMLSDWKHEQGLEGFGYGLLANWPNDPDKQIMVYEARNNYSLFSFLRQSHIDLQHLLQEIPLKDILAVLVLGEASRGRKDAAIAAGQELLQWQATEAGFHFAWNEAQKKLDAEVTRWDRKRQREIARRDRPDALQKLIIDIVIRNPDASKAEVLGALEGKCRCGVVEAFHEDLIEWTDSSGKARETPISAIKDRISRARRKLPSR